MMVKDIAFVAYPSDDVAGTRAWYENTLGRTFAGPDIEDGAEKYNEAHLATSCPRATRSRSTSVGRGE
jgi:hypothetical protein